MRPQLSCQLPMAFSVLAMGIGILAFHSCSSDGFKGKKKPEAQKIEKQENRSPNENDTNPDNTPIEPEKQILLELQPAPPESWWNNCVEIVYKGQSFDGGCSKLNGGLKSLKLKVEDPDTCADLEIRVQTYKNTDRACGERAAIGEATAECFSDVPDFTRSTKDVAIAVNFRWEPEANSTSSLVKFEDQPGTSIEKALNSPEKSEELGVDFNDVVLRIVPKGIEVKVALAGSAAQTPASTCPSP
jgi:hypothetical protein